MKEITLSTSLTTIGPRAFIDCSSLTSIILPNSLTTIEWSAFNSCSSLTSITLPNSITSIGGGAFYGCTSLTSITLPNSITSIEEGAFYLCTSLTSITLPNSITTIGKSAFYRCTSLTSITIPNSVKHMASCAFEDCFELVDIKLSDNLESIDSCLFKGCRELKSISIPGKVNVIEESAFDGCSNLEEIKYEYGETNLAVDFMFRNNSPWCYLMRLLVNRGLEYDSYSSSNSPLRSLCELTLGSRCKSFNLRHIAEDLEEIISYAALPPELNFCGEYRYSKTKVSVPQQYLEVYRNAPVWKNFWVIEGFDASGVESVEAEQEEKCEIGRYDLNGRRVAQDFNGISIIRYSDGSTQKVLPTK